MANKTVKAGDCTIVVSKYGDLKHHVDNRILNAEAAFAKDMISRWAMTTATASAGGTLLKPGEAVERAFEIARLTFAHIKAHKMDVPFPIKKVFGDDQSA
jgi:hypothetical protein